MTTKMHQVEIDRDTAIDYLWITAAANKSGRVGALIGEPWMLLGAQKAAERSYRRVMRNLDPNAPEGWILTLYTAGGTSDLYVRPYAKPFDPDYDPWKDPR